ncbi:MAG TPA: response regulator [Polyangiales bacterium]|nr:response regulator [Polyangiales bacterium]
MRTDSLSPADILVVDDNPNNLVAIETALGELGARVQRAQSGSEALRLLLEHDFALILLDVKMPTMDGFETAKLIRARRRSSHTPIIFITAYDRDDSEILAAYELGAVDFLFKPIVPDVLRAKAAVFVELQLRTAEVARQAEQIREHERREHERSLAEERSRWEGEAMLRQMEQLAEVDRRKDRFLALLSHELRNPLAPIMAGLELLRSSLERAGPAVDDQARRVRDILEKQARHLGRLVDDLLDLSRINTDKIELRREPITLQDLTQQALDTCRPLLDERCHELHLSMPEETRDPLWVNGDPVRLLQVLSNLLNNAARYTPEHGTIEVNLIRDPDDFATITVRDNGRGIAPEFLSKVFDAFTQEDQRTGAGLGVGLSVVRQLVAMHEGEVNADSAGPGRGSEFRVRLPLIAAGEPKPAQPAAVNGSEKPRVRPLSILLIDDNEDIRELMSALLRRWGHDVQVAPDGEEGCELALRGKPDVAFVDIGLPGMDGYGVAARLRTERRSDQLRLVAMTGFGQESDKRRALDAGFDLHIVKPASVEALQQALSFKEV